MIFVVSGFKCGLIYRFELLPIVIEKLFRCDFGACLSKRSNSASRGSTGAPPAYIDVEAKEARMTMVARSFIIFWQNMKRHARTFASIV